MHIPDEMNVPEGTLGELFTLAEEVEARVDALLDHSGIRYYDINAGSSGVWYMGWNPHRWTPLTGEGQRARGEARELAALWTELSRQAIRASAAENLDEFEKAGSDLEYVLLQDMGAYRGAVASTIEGVRQRVHEARARELAARTGSLDTRLSPSGGPGVGSKEDGLTDRR
jgi:hypothetical protein